MSIASPAKKNIDVAGKLAAVQEDGGKLLNKNIDLEQTYLTRLPESNTNQKLDTEEQPLSANMLNSNQNELFLPIYNYINYI